jgi:hypothetical protein
MKINKLNYIKINDISINYIYFIAIIVSLLRGIKVVFFTPLTYSDVMGPLNYIYNNPPANSDLIISESNRLLSNLPLFQIISVIPSGISSLAAGIIGYLVLSFIFFIGVYRLLSSFGTSNAVSLIFSIILSLVSHISSISSFGYPFMPSMGITLGALAQNVLPILIYYLIKNNFLILILLLIPFTLFHPAVGINFIAYSILYIIFHPSVKQRNKINTILVLGIIILSITLMIKLSQPVADITYIEWRILSMKFSPHTYTWLHKEQFIGLLNELILVLSMMFIINKNKMLVSIKSLLYWTSISISYVLIMILIALMADKFERIDLIAFYPTRLSSILLVIFLVQISIWLTKSYETNYKNAIIDTVMIFIGFFAYPFLLYFIIIKAFGVFKSLRYEKLIKIIIIIFLSALWTSSETFITINLRLSILYPVCIFIILDILINYNSVINNIIIKLSKNMILPVIIVITSSMLFSYQLGRRIIGMSIAEKEIVSLITSTPKESIFLYLETPEEVGIMGNILFFIENAYLRNSLPSRAAISSVIYTPALGTKIINDIKLLYGIDLLEKNQNFNLINKIITLTINDWQLIKERHPNFRYVIGTKYLPEMDKKIFKVTFKNSDFIMYEYILAEK